MKTKEVQTKNKADQPQKTTALQLVKEPSSQKSDAVQKEEPKKDIGPIEEQVKSIMQGLKPQTAEERITNAENFKILTTRFEFLKRKDEELKRFTLQNSGTNAKLVLKNQAGQDFEVTNSDVIAKAITVMGDELTKMLNATRDEVVSFAI